MEQSNSQMFFSKTYYPWLNSPIVIGMAAFILSSFSLEQPMPEPTLVTVQEEEVYIHNLDMGFNLGYLSYMKYEAQLKEPGRRILEDGFTHLRVYEPFTFGMLPGDDQAVQYLNRLNELGFQTLVSLSNYPYEVEQSRVDAHHDKLKIESAATFTNRFGPDDLEAYELFLHNFLTNLQESGALSSIQFEIGNEVDAPKYFWGESGEMLNIIDVTVDVINEFEAQSYCCGFTTSLITRADPHHPDFAEYVDTSQRFGSDFGLSWHYYFNSKNKDNSFADIDYPHLEGSLITECNLFSHQREQHTEKNDYTNSPKFVNKLIELLQFSYDNKVAAVYFYKLMDVEKKQERLGFFDVNGLPKESYEQLLKVKQVIDDGYHVEEDENSISIIGENSTLQIAKTDIENPQINGDIQHSSANFSLGQTLSANEWIIFSHN